MLDETTVIRKAYRSGFLVDKPKMSRILSIVEQRFMEAVIEFKPKFATRLRNGKVTELRSLDHLFALDNAVRNPIEALDITISKENGSDSTSTTKIYLSYDGKEQSSVELSINSDNSKWANELFAELEEQVERTLLSAWIYKFSKPSEILPLIATLLIFPFFIFTMLRETPTPSFDRSLNLSDENRSYLASQAKMATTPERKLEFLFEMHRRQLEPMNKGGGSGIEDLITVRNVLLALPFLVLLTIVGYIVVTCYPKGVFIWGDYEEHYAALVARRRTLWTVVVISFAVSVVANLFVMSLPLGSR